MILSGIPGTPVIRKNKNYRYRYNCIPSPGFCSRRSLYKNIFVVKAINTHADVDCIERLRTRELAGCSTVDPVFHSLDPVLSCTQCRRPAPAHTSRCSRFPDDTEAGPPARLCQRLERKKKKNKKFWAWRQG